MKKTLLYLATLATLTTGGAVTLNTVNNNLFGTTVVHAEGSWILLHPLDAKTAQYVKYDSTEGVVLTDAGEQLYNDGMDTKNQFIFTTAPYIRDESQVTETGPNAGGWVGQMDTVTFTPKDSSSQPISIPIISTISQGDVSSDANLLSEYISQIEDYYNRTHQTVDVDYSLMQTALGLELAGVIPKDSKLEATVKAMGNNQGVPNSNNSSTNNSNDATSANTSSNSKSNKTNKVSNAKHDVQLAQKAVKKATQNVKANKHKSKNDQQNAKKKYKQAKTALKKAKAALKKLEVK